MPNSPISVKVEVIPEVADRCPPIVGYMPSGFGLLRHDEGGNLLASLKFYRNVQRGKVDKSLLRNGNKRRSSERLELVARCEKAGVDFVGTNYSGEAMAPQVCTYALGVFDKDAKMLRIMPIAANKIFRLDPKIRLSATASEEPSTPKNAQLLEAGEAVDKTELAIKFGAKKHAKAAKAAQRLKKLHGSQADTHLAHEIDRGLVNQTALVSATPHASRNIPPYNTSASIQADAFPLNQIILSGEWDHLLDVYQLLQSPDSLASLAYPSFVCNRVRKFLHIQDEEEKKKWCAVLSFMTHLIRFKDLFAMDGSGVGEGKAHRFPSVIRLRLKNMFMVPTQTRMESDKLDLLVSYVLVLTLHVDNFLTDPEDICRSLRLNAFSVRKRYELLGCKLVRHNNAFFQSLPLPLHFPVNHKFRR